MASAALRTTESKVRWAVVGFISAMVFIDLTFAIPIVTGAIPLDPDFGVMWAGLRATNPYSLHEVAALLDKLGSVTPGPRPFVYPPTSLPFFFPFSIPPFQPALWIWTVLSVVAFWTASRRITNHTALVFLTPNVLTNIVFGQTALFTGAAAIWGITLLRTQPVLAGVCFGLGAALKPQCFFLIPLALIAGRHWRAIIPMALVWAMLALPAFDYWSAWIGAMRDFPNIVAQIPLLANYGATPRFFAAAVGAPTLPFQLVGIVAGVAVVWLAFRTEDNRVRLIGLVCGTLLASPYAMKYELAPLAPALIESFMLNTVKGAIIALPLLATSVFPAVPTIAVSGLLTALRSRRELFVSSPTSGSE